MSNKNAWEIADDVIREAYPPGRGYSVGYWGCQRIPNAGILRGAIAKAIAVLRSENAHLNSLVAPVSKLMLCFPEKIAEGEIDTDFNIPALIVNDVRNALSEIKPPPV